MNPRVSLMFGRAVIESEEYSLIRILKPNPKNKFIATKCTNKK